MNEELCPCPFCGSVEIKHEFDGDGHFWNECQNCGATGPFNSKYDGDEGDDFVDWNTRPLEDALRAKLEIAKEAIKKAERLLDNNFGFRSQETIDAWNILCNLLQKLESEK